MSKFDLLKETFLGNISARIPIALWKHHPEVDRTPEGLAGEEIAFHKMFDSDILKISFFGHYPCTDFGCTASYDGAITGSTTLTSPAVKQVSDWEALETPDVNAGDFGKQVRAVEVIQKYAHGNVPTVATVFDPSMVADKICDKKFTEYIDEHPDVMRSALDMITNVMIDFARATLEAGANGIFLASQHSTHASVTDEQYEAFVFPYDLKMISRLRGKADFIIMHLHAREDNEEIRFDKIARTIGLDAVNWEDQTSSLSLKEGRKRSRKTVLGGIDHNGIFRTGTPDEAKEQVLQAVDDAGYKKLIVAPGCVITVDTPVENIQAIADAIRAIDPFDNE
ncbi:MAG: uroporphyrinogen decarboxylase family protein [Candidatus Thorarchaeota archaeon]|jgi:uroporphyrinogen decarboxylase